MAVVPQQVAIAEALRRLPPVAAPLDLRRDRLIDLLRVDPSPVALPCAPAGSGKTSLLATWVARYPDLTIAWLTLDRHDDDPVRLWAGILAELRRSDPRAEREVHHTAARWYLQQGDHLHAMEHLAAAGDDEQVLELARARFDLDVQGALARLEASPVLPRRDLREPRGPQGHRAARPGGGAVGRTSGAGASPSIAHTYLLLGWTAARGDRDAAELAASRSLSALASDNQPDVELAARSLEAYLFADRPDAFEMLQEYLRHDERLAQADVSPALLRAMLQLDAGQPVSARRELAPVLDGTARCHLITTEVHAGLLTVREIAAARSLSVNTVKSHLRAIHRKLEVDGRGGAVDAARRRGLL